MKFLKISLFVAVMSMSACSLFTKQQAEVQKGLTATVKFVCSQPTATRDQILSELKNAGITLACP